MTIGTFMRTWWNIYQGQCWSRNVKDYYSSLDGLKYESQSYKYIRCYGNIMLCYVPEAPREARAIVQVR